MPTVCPMTLQAMVEAQFITTLIGDGTSSDINKEDVDYSYILLCGRTFQLDNSDTSAHNSLLLTMRVGRKVILTNPVDCCQRC